MAKTAKISKSSYLTDLQSVLYTVMEQFQRIYGTIALIDNRSDRELIRFDGGAEEDAASLALDKLPLTVFMSMIYDYAVDGRLDKQLMNDYEVIDEDVLGFFDGLRDFPLIEANADIFPLETITHVLDVFRARVCLDNGPWIIGEGGVVARGYLQLKDVAVLAGIDEKTARNLAHPKARNRLVTENWEGRTIVEADFARQWLIQRGFKDTVEFDSALDRDLENRGFWSLADLGEYVAGHRQKSEMTVEILCEKADFDLEARDWLQNLESGKAAFDKDRLFALATVLCLKPKPFVLAALKIHQSSQWHELQNQL